MRKVWAMAEKVVIIGGGAAGIDVLELLLRGREEADGMEITLLKKEEEGFFSMCGLPYALQGVCSIDALNLFEPDFYREKGIDFRTSIEVVSVNTEDSYVTLDSGEVIQYDNLVIATGSIPVIPRIEGTNLKGVYTLGNSRDGELLGAAIDAGGLSNALIIGGGWIGLQTAVAFKERGVRTKVIEKIPHLLPSLLDPDMALIIKNSLDSDISFLLGLAVDAIKGNGYVESVRVGGEDIPADAVLISAGMHPNVDLSRKAGIEIGASGGIVTNFAMRAKKGRSYLDNVYALGDCAEVIDAVTYRPRLSQLASTALIQARVVASNILDISSSYHMCLSPAVANISGMQVGSVGITTQAANKYGISIKVGRATKQTKARYFPGRKTITAKLIFEAFHDTLVGAQIISEDTVAERINELTVGIKAGITARDIWMRERCFDPSLSMIEDVIVDAAMRAAESSPI
jgi:NADH oxidase (H2O2-forming)